VLTPVLSLDMEDPLDFIRKHGSFPTVKVGHNLAVKGKKILDELQNMGLKIILDLKFCDIPSTVIRSIRSWDHESVIGFTLHSAAGIEIEGKLEDYIDLIIELDKIGSSFVLPGHWAIGMRKKLKGKFLIPGIRMRIKADDQRDIITINEIKELDDFAVIGREVYLADDPGKRIKEIEEMILL